ncbi:MAG: hypothetical protein ABSE62_00030 [Chthoniobacteraceae bacterium]|jgi:hypothetical protein
MENQDSKSSENVTDRIHWGNVMLCFVTSIAALSAIFGGRAFKDVQTNAGPSPSPSAAIASPSPH